MSKISDVLYKVVIAGFCLSLICFALNVFHVSWAWAALGYVFTSTLALGGVLILIKVLSKNEESK